MMLDGLLIGYIFCAALVASLFFIKFWRRTGDRLFLAFALVIATEGVTRLIAFFSEAPSDRIPIANLIRLLAYVALLVSIVAKNRRSR